MAYRYFKLDGLPCRVEENGEHWGKAEIYHQGEGLVPYSKTEILFHGIPLDRQEFEALVLSVTRSARAK